MRRNSLLKIVFIISSSFFLIYFYWDLDDDDDNSSSHFCRNYRNLVERFDLKEQYDEAVIRRHPNLPVFLTTSTHLSSLIPEIPNIRWNGIVYQESWKETPKFLLYSAHFDSRTKSKLVVRIISLYDGEREMKKPYNISCQFWFDEEENPVMVPVFKIDSIKRISGYERDQLNPFGITCKVPEFQNLSRAPVAVSLVKKSCQKPSNILKINGSPLRKKEEGNTMESIKIGICGKALFYYNEDFSARLIEWIEVMRALGVAKIFLYKATCHENVKMVLDYYEKIGFVDIISFYYPPPYVQEGTFLRLWTKSQKTAYRRAQPVYLNDCIMRNKDNFDYLGVFDSDEVPLLRKHLNLQEFLKYLTKSDTSTSGFFLKWKLFYPDLTAGPSAEEIPESFYILRHNRRTKLISRETPVLEETGKTIYNTKYVLWIAVHKPLKLLTVPYQLDIDRDVAYTAHFGSHPCEEVSNCYREDLEEENVLLHYKNQIITNVRKAYQEIHSLAGYNE